MKSSPNWMRNYCYSMKMSSKKNCYYSRMNCYCLIETSSKMKNSRKTRNSRMKMSSKKNTPTMTSLRKMN